ncbi:hypothetical protein CRYUN_Cryun31cG0072700 [Craigia yunnanensis]
MEETTSAFTAIAIDKDRNSQLAVKWAVDNLFNSSGSKCFLIHVRSRSLHPQDFEASPKEGQPPSEAELQQFFLPYRGDCARKGIQSLEVVLHDIDVPSALVDFVNNNDIGNIVVGASSRNVLTRSLSLKHIILYQEIRKSDVPTSLLKLAPESCVVYVISRGNIQISRLAHQPQSPQDSITPHKSLHLKALLSKHAFDSPNIEELSRATPYYFQASWPLAHPCSYTTVSSCEGSRYRIISDRISDSFRVTPHDKLKTNDEIKLSTLSTGSQAPESLN